MRALVVVPDLCARAGASATQGAQRACRRRRRWVWAGHMQVHDVPFLLPSPALVAPLVVRRRATHRTRLDSLLRCVSFLGRLRLWPIRSCAFRPPPLPSPGPSLPLRPPSLAPSLRSLTPFPPALLASSRADTTFSYQHRIVQGRLEHVRGIALLQIKGEERMRAEVLMDPLERGPLARGWVGDWEGSVTGKRSWMRARSS
ncbi:hypothetical protein B0H13DRAFT_124105 [Mycena leptocephala]|nr:hypothetical protein B0H13DRAFT_124105 [Mycena leptocephala]